ncbi:MAG TPA: hypothetical protein VFV01_18125 [Spirillospora sp.]|nr:hypothetical protein [Spirillospora sp.]
MPIDFGSSGSTGQLLRHARQIAGSVIARCGPQQMHRQEWRAVSRAFRVDIIGDWDNWQHKNPLIRRGAHQS